MAVLLVILLVPSNAMMIRDREHMVEVAVLKTIGISDRRLFGLVMLEAGLITLTGAVLGLGGPKLLYRAPNFSAPGFLPGFNVNSTTPVGGGAIALLLLPPGGLVPPGRAARLPALQGLRP